MADGAGGVPTGGSVGVDSGASWGQGQAVTDVTATPERLQSLFDGLAEILATAAEQHRANLRTFFSGLAPAVSVAVEAQRRFDRVAASRFSVFGYFKEDENLLSSIFADLLRPDGSHGQGTAFLRLFLEEIDRGGKCRIRSSGKYGGLERCSVYTEYPTPAGRRVDIVLKLDDKWIGIENKPRAGEQDNQLQHYLEFLQDQDEDACVLYLSGRGGDAGTIEDVDHYLTIPYGRTPSGPSVAHWIAECHMRCGAENVRWFLKDMLKYIGDRFYAEEPDEEAL